MFSIIILCELISEWIDLRLVFTVVVGSGIFCVSDIKLIPLALLGWTFYYSEIGRTGGDSDKIVIISLI